MRRVAFGAIALLLGCADPREAELAQELVSLQESRVARASLERMRVEVEAAEAENASLEAALEALRATFGELQAAVGAAEAAIQHEVELNGRLNDAIKAAQQRLQEGGARQQELEKEIAIARARAQTFQDQAAVLARELRPEDPDWARRLRVRSLREFLSEVAATWPGDPVLSEAARAPIPADDQEAMRVGAAVVARIRDRVAEVYGLGDGGAAAGTPAVAAGAEDS
jgi:hypothetical protein